MAQVEVFDEEDAREPLFVGEFGFLPRAGESLSIEVDGVFSYYRVTETWFRHDEESDAFLPCLRVELEDQNRFR